MGMKYEIVNKDWNMIKSMIDELGEFTTRFMDWYNSLEDYTIKFMIAVMVCTKIRRNEYQLIKTIRLIKGKYYLVLEKGLKKSENKREISEIKPFYDFIMKNIKKVTQTFDDAKSNVFMNEYSITKFFKEVLKPELGKPVCPRAFEKLTITYLSMNTSRGNKSLSNVTGHKSSKNVDPYIATPELKPLNVSKRLEGDLKKLSLQNLMVANDLYEELEEIRNHNLVIESKVDKILKLLES